MSTPASLTFGSLLRYLRKQAGMTQSDLAAALGYSTSLISSLETGDRLPDLEAVRNRFVAALGLQDAPQRALDLIEQAALARGTRLAGTTPPLPIAHRDLRGESHLPALPTALIGRTNEVNQLGNRLLGHAGRLLTLVGPPGVGKTTLALAVAAQVQHYYSDGACFVPLAAVSDSMQMTSTILSAIAPEDAISGSPEARLIERLRRKTMLLVLDNLEQIADAAPLIASLLDQCPSLTILATSRERLHLRAEQRFKVPPLHLASAIQLFVQRAQAVDSHFRLTADNEPTIAALCTRLDCLPLALELCAAQAEIFTPVQMLDQARAHPLELLVDGPLDLPPHQRTLRHALQRSYALLPVDEQAIFRRLAVFAGGFDLAAAEAMGEWPLPTLDSASLRNLRSPILLLQSLVAKSLVRTETLVNSEQRFSLLETIREFALEQLQLAGEDEAARQRHYAIYLQRFRNADTHLRGPDAPAWFARLQPEHDNLRAAVQWTLDEALYVQTAWLLVATSWYCRLRGQWYVELGWLQSLLPHRHRFEPRLRLAFLVALFSVARSSEDATVALRFADELDELRSLCPDKCLHAGALHFVAVATSDFAQAKQFWLHALEMARLAAVDPQQSGNELGVSADPLFVLSAVADNFALHLIEHGEFAEATEFVQESLKACEARGFRSGIGACLCNLGRLWLLQGDLARAFPLLYQAEVTTRAGIHPSVLAKVIPFLALANLYQNNAAEARRLLLESLEIWMSIRDKRYLSRICIYLAEVALWEDQIDDAEQWLNLCAAYQVDPRRIGVALVNCFFVAARLAVERKHFQRAAILCGMAEEMRVRTHCTLVEPVRAQVDAALAEVQAALDPVTFADAFAAGRYMTQDEAFTMLSTALPSEVRQDILRQQTQSLNVT